MVIAIEPMINMGTKNIKTTHKDGWTITTADGNQVHILNTMLQSLTENLNCYPLLLTSTKH